MQPRELANAICDALQDAGFQAFLVGGCVRDLLLEREPADYDVATDATPDEVMRIFPRTWAVGAQFGVVLVPVEDEQQVLRAQNTRAQDDNAKAVVEVATFRSDGLY